MTRHEWLLKRNCSLTPKQLGIAYAVLCLASFSVALMFTLQGAWIVLAFSVLEMTVVALAFLHYARHATDHEHIALMDDCLLIEQIQAGQMQQTRLDPYRTRVVLPCRTQDLISLVERDVKIEVGKFLTDRKRQQVAKEIQHELRLGSLMCR